MNILVTGGAGFIGSHTAVELYKAGYVPVIVDNLSNSDKSVYGGLTKITGEDITHYEYDILDTEKLASTIKKHECEAVIHFAAYKAVGESVQNPLRYYRNNVSGMISVLEAMQSTKVSNLIFSSSTTVYGDPDKLPIGEAASLKPATNPYGSTKQMSERIIEDTCNVTDIKSILLRYFNPIGAHPSGLIGELPIGKPNCLVPYITQATSGLIDKLTVFGDDYDTLDGSAIRDYIHVVDLAKAHVKALRYLEKNRRISTDTFNIGTGKGSSVLEIIKTFEKVNNVKVPYHIGSRREGDVAATYSDVKKANEVLKWEAELSIEQALEDAWRWQKNLTK